jgi:pantoate--beta-alanine ligase
MTLGSVDLDVNEPSGAGPFVAHNIADMHKQVSAWRQNGDLIALVPTMGALHAGHISLVEEARRQAQRVVMSIFVNPAQFAPDEDFAAYPRTLEADIERFGLSGGDLIFVPSVDEIYPQGFSTRLEVGGPALAGLEDCFRPDHFGGVALVVAKLLNQVKPDVALFGEKDYQQLKVIDRMAKDLDFATRIVGAPIIRESDGLALSSRNVYLSPDERKVAPRLYAALRQCAKHLKSKMPMDVALVSARETLRDVGFLIDYLEARESETLAPVETFGGVPIRLLAAAKLGRTRLIDNLAVEPS